MSFWPEDADDIPRALGGSVVSAPGFPARDELIDRYAARSGRTLSDIRFYEVLAIWKLAILLEASYHRFLAGTTDDPFFAQLEVGVPQLLARARRLTGGGALTSNTGP